MASAPEVVASVINPARAIPQTWRESISYWWNSDDKETAAAQERLLRRLPFFSSSPTAPADPTTAASPAEPISSGVVGRLSHFELSGPKRYLNQFSITPTKPVANAPPPTVVLHGYGAGLGFFFMNYAALGDWAARRGGSVYALDWLGMGLSARVPFKVRAKREDTEKRVSQAEDFFLDALEEWREKNGFEKITLVGHSLGGYLSAAYALRHPDRVSRLILLSPAGIPRNPNKPSAAEEATLEAVAEAEQKQSLLRKLGTHAWEAGWSPFQVVRSATFFGPLLVGRYSTWRFRHFTDEDARDMNNYIWHITRAKGSGEYCISHILEPGAHARLPMVERMDKLKMPVTFLSCAIADGDQDWMDEQGGKETVRRLRQAGNSHAKSILVQYAGHHLYLDNPDETNKYLIRELDKTVPSL
ncbi:hypothetical protein FS837_003590 [Tulasnella sp. UAMH 9824]|nr:hypothetical protein FS837_003590 [Tulasnella sp. UAMH 9824]